MASIIKVDTIQDQDGNNIINESANTITIGASGDAITIPSGATFASVGIDDNATSTAITINSSQNVDIAGTLTIDNTLSISNGTASGFLQTSGSFLQFGTSTAGDIPIYTNNVERMRINSSGNVGIGTASPQEKLHIETPTGSANETGLKIRNGTAVNDVMAQIKLQGGYAATSNEATAIISGGRESSGNASKITFSTGTTSQSERMRITSTGNVGIGTTSPTAPLTVIGGDNTTQMIIGGNTGATGRGLRIATDLLSSNNDIAILDAPFTSGTLAFQTVSSERMRIDRYGDVLVNTTSNGTESNLNVQGQFGMSSARGFIFETQEGRNGSYSSITLQFTTGANGRTCFIESMVGSSGYYLYHIAHRYRGEPTNVLVNQGNGPTISWSVSNSGSNSGSVYTYVVNFPSSTSHPYAKFKVSLGGYITTPITSTSLTFA